MSVAEEIMVRKCCVCERVEEGGHWIGNTSADSRPVSHVYCPHCFEGIMDQVGRFAVRRTFEGYVHAESGRG